METYKSNKLGLRRTILLECRRATLSPRYPIGVGLAVLWFIWNAAENVETYEHAAFAGVTQMLRLGITGESATGPVLLLLAAFPYSFSHLDERDCGYREQAVRRVGISAYGTAKALSVWVSGFLTGAAAVLVYIGLLSVAGIPHTVRETEVAGTYAELVTTMGAGWYYAAESLRIGLLCGQAALFSLLVMNWLPSVYVGFLAPMIGYYLVRCVEGILGTWINSELFWALFEIDGLFFGQPFSNPLIAYIWTAVVLLGLALCFGIRFLIRLGTEHTT